MGAVFCRCSRWDWICSMAMRMFRSIRSDWMDGSVSSVWSEGAENFNGKVVCCVRVGDDKVGGATYAIVECSGELPMTTERHKHAIVVTKNITNGNPAPSRNIRNGILPMFLLKSVFEVNNMN